MKNARFVNFLLALLRVGMGAFFVYTGIQKIADLGATAQFMTNSRLLPEFFSLPIACIGVAMELIVGVCLVLRYQYRGAAAWGVVMTGVFLLLYAQAWARGLELSCNCMGEDHLIVNYPLDTGIRMLLLGAMLLLFWESRFRQETPYSTRRLDFSDV